MRYLILVFVLACSSQATGYRIVQEGGSLVPSGAPGDSVALRVNQIFSDGTSALVPKDRVLWSGAPLVTAQVPAARDDSPFPAPANQPTAVFLSNPLRPDREADLMGVLFILDAGASASASIAVTATLTDGPVVTGTVAVTAAAQGDAKRGAVVYGASGTNCARCHGETGHGSPANADGTTYTFDHATYDFPAPGINAEDGNLASDPGWTTVLFAMSAKADVDNGAFALRAPMPDYLTYTNDEHPEPLSARDFADILAFLQTQTH